MNAGWAIGRGSTDDVIEGLRQIAAQTAPGAPVTFTLRRLAYAAGRSVVSVNGAVYRWCAKGWIVREGFDEEGFTLYRVVDRGATRKM